MDKKQIASILDAMGTLFELKGENPFKCRAFHNGARVVDALTVDIALLVESGDIRSVKGIGEGLSRVIGELVRTGSSAEYESVKASLPEGLLQMLRITGLGPKRIKILHEKLNIKTVDELKSACENHRLAKLDGFGEKTEENILKGIESLARSSDKHLYPSAKGAADRILEVISRLPEVKRCEVAGSLRRKKEIVGDIDIVVSASEKSRKKIFDVFVGHVDVQSVVARGETKSSVVLKSGINCDLRIVGDREYPFALNYFTGSKEHNVEMRSRARKYGLSLNEYAFTGIEGEKKPNVPRCKSEEGIYKALDLEYIPPELRENMGEIESAEKRALPKLIGEEDIRGTFHCHTNYSDGANSLVEMADAARKLGWSYLGIADHSKVAAYAGGLSEAKAKQQQKEIEKLNAGLKGFRLFKGTEVDILSDGSLDYPDKLLATFDYVVVAIHSKFKMTESEATKRMIKALKNKYVSCIGHPTGRLLLSRDGYPINMIEVIDAASDYGKGIEINAHPFRLDLDWRYVKYAKEKKVPIFINPDAHSTEGLNDVSYGVGIARKGWLEPKDVVNAWDLKKVTEYFKSRH
ncbi:MAG: DNA polymerase/3'-5' exonuclease PolX [Ignavibacteriales bacterium]|nr:DNA polymerase/3'-5' exonuclease PolX [Ignavibacteriales bacterium]